jgi:hypothetical protein
MKPATLADLVYDAKKKQTKGEKLLAHDAAGCPGRKIRGASICAASP